MCRAEFLHYLRIREWQDLHGQLRQVVTRSACDRPARSTGRRAGRRRDRRPPGAAGRAALARRAARRATTREYPGARGARFAIWPGSALFKKPPALGDGRRAGRDRPAVGPRPSRGSSRSGPSSWRRTWSSAPTASRTGRRKQRRGAWPTSGSRCTACRSWPRRTVGYGRDRPGAVARAVHPARAGGGRLAHAPPRSSTTTASCSRTSRSSSTGPGGATSSSTTRRCSTSTTQRIPADVVSGAALRRAGGRRPAASSPDLLTFDRGDAGAATSAAAVDARRLPRRVAPGRRCALPLTYQFEPGADADGVTVHVPLAVLNQVDAGRLRLAGARAAARTWSTALIRSLPKPLRRSFVPAPDHAARGAGAASSRGDGAAARRARPRAAPTDRRRRPAGRLGARTRCPTTCG